MSIAVLYWHAQLMPVAIHLNSCRGGMFERARLAPCCCAAGAIGKKPPGSTVTLPLLRAAW